MAWLHNEICSIENKIESSYVDVDFGKIEEHLSNINSSIKILHVNRRLKKVSSKKQAKKQY